MGSSSKRKSSKKKSSKLSSQARKMKKSRRTKSKKLGRQHRHDSSTYDSLSSHSIPSAGNHSYTSYSDDDSMSSASVSTPPSSEGAYRRRKHVLRSRGNLKKTRKRARRRSSSRESIGELAHMKKRKRSKKDSDSKARAKSRRKKPRKDASISSATSDSRSCFTCKGRSKSDSEESERERVSRFREKKKDKRHLGKDKRGTKISISRSPSHSSYSRSRDQGGSVSHSEERFPSENNSRRLRSVITFAEQRSEGEGNKWEKDLQNEEIVYDHDYYPSRSSSGGGSKKESPPRSPTARGEKQTESVKYVADHVVTEPSGIVNDAHEQYVHDPLLNEIETLSSAKESRNQIPPADTGSGGDDLEAILRQKALQNFKKFRGGHKSSIKPTANQKNKDNNDGNVNPSSNYMAEIVQSWLPGQAPLTEVERDVSAGELTGQVSGIAKQNTNHPPDRLALSENSKKEGRNIGHPIFGESITGNSSFRERSSGLETLNPTTTSGASPDKNLRKTECERKTTTLVETTSVTGNSSFLGRSSDIDTLNKTTTSVASPDKNLMETETSERETEPKITRSVSPTIGINTGTDGSSVTVEPASCATSGGQSLNNQKDEAKNSAQYQQKTMSVMRGGEMVQVNYKVYIPQRAPALARRQLKR